MHSDGRSEAVANPAIGCYSNHLTITSRAIEGAG